jgi:hypothetical protein
VAAKAPAADAAATSRRSATPAGHAASAAGRTGGRAADPAQARPLGALPLLLSLTLVGGLLLLLSRFLVFESTYTVLPQDFRQGIHWISWLIGAGLPLLVAFQLLVVQGTASWGVALAGGLVAGAALSQLDLVLATWAYFPTPETSEMPGPGWWATLLGAVILIGCAIVVLRQPPLRARPGVRSDWRAFSGVLLVAGGVAAWVIALTEASPWLMYVEPALLLAAVCLPQVVLDLNLPQRLFGLAAVTVLGSWMAAGHVQALIIEDHPVDARATVVALVSVLCSVAGCYLAQAPARRRPARPAGEPAGSR